MGSPEEVPPTAPPASAVLERLFGEHVDSIHLYVDLLIHDGVERGLLGPREAARIWDRHILNCAVVAPAFEPHARVCDLGSGAGLPGIVLALARPDLEVVLLEPLLRRATFLTEAVSRLDLARCSVVRSRAEDLSDAGGFDAVTARAVAPLDRLAGWALPLLRPGGRLIALKGERASDELAAAGDALARLGVGHADVTSYGAGIVDPETVVVRIASGRAPT